MIVKQVNHARARNLSSARRPDALREAKNKVFSREAIFARAREMRSLCYPLELKIRERIV